MLSNHSCNFLLINEMKVGEIMLISSGQLSKEESMNILILSLLIVSALCAYSDAHCLRNGEVRKLILSALINS